MKIKDITAEYAATLCDQAGATTLAADIRKEDRGYPGGYLWASGAEEGNEETMVLYHYSQDGQAYSAIKLHDCDKPTTLEGCCEGFDGPGYHLDPIEVDELGLAACLAKDTNL